MYKKKSDSEYKKKKEKGIMKETRINHKIMDRIIIEILLKTRFGKWGGSRSLFFFFF